MLMIHGSTFIESPISAGFVGSEPGKYLSIYLALSLFAFQTQTNITLWRAVKIVTDFIIGIAMLRAASLIQNFDSY